MLNMTAHHPKSISSVFITFSGNCKKALSFYQKCFGGKLQFQTFDKNVNGYSERPVISGSLVSHRIIIHGSDLVPNEGRKLGNYISIFLQCNNTYDRRELADKLEYGHHNFFLNNYDDQKLIEIIDEFDVRWILAV